VFLTPLLDVIRKAFLGIKSFVAEETLGKQLTKHYDTFLPKVWDHLSKIADNRLLMHLPAVNRPYDWGENCFNNVERGGYCEFRIKHYLALQAFSQLSLAHLERIPKHVKMAIMHSDLDGPARDSVTTAVVSRLRSQGNNVSKCRYELTCPINEITFADNRCGVPHSAFSRAEAHVKFPFESFWEQDLFENIGNFFEDRVDAIGLVGFKAGSFCKPTTGTMGFGPMFDGIGARYIQKAQKRYRRL
jgi:hypothetical protein